MNAAGYNGVIMGSDGTWVSVWADESITWMNAVPYFVKRGGTEAELWEQARSTLGEILEAP